MNSVKTPSIRASLSRRSIVGSSNSVMNMSNILRSCGSVNVLVEASFLRSLGRSFSVNFGDSRDLEALALTRIWKGSWSTAVSVG